MDPLLLQALLTNDEKERLCQQLERRIISRVPVPYLTHQAYFCDLTFYVDERVLIPRSPIAELIQQQFAPWVDAESVTRVLDLCTGSGCIAIACCYAFPEALVDAVDISKEALEVAEINRQRHELQDVLTLIESDCFAEVPLTTYDIIVSNPPYVSGDEMQTLPDEYSHEPRLALEATNHGLAIVENILFTAHRYLSPEGILIVEVGNSEEALMEAYPEVPFTWLDFEKGGHGVFLLTHQQIKDYFNGPK
jgi:ribosomal protein L3 glutamine methyltransferase